MIQMLDTKCFVVVPIERIIHLNLQEPTILQSEEIPAVLFAQKYM